MKSLLELCQLVVQDLGDLCRVSTSRDVETIARRTGSEGVGFLTLTLPRFSKDLERSLDDGFIAPDAFAGFRRRAGLPLFLGGFLEQIFQPYSGTILDAPSTSAILAVRQIGGLCAKVELECSESRVRAAYQKYIECEQQLQEHPVNGGRHDFGDFRRVSRLLLAGVFSKVDHAVAYTTIESGADFGIIPRHGSGATADRLSGNTKYDLAEWTTRLEGVFSSSTYLLPNGRFPALLDRVELLEPGRERPVKVTHVPKTLDKPRIIAEEPTCMMFVQQGLWRRFLAEIESDRLVGPLIGFTDQTPNRLMARKGSIDGSLATLDLSDASDRVSNLLVTEMLASHPHLREGVQACRSQSARVPGHGVIPLTKFASMGSALTFPVEAMVFTTLVFMGIERANKTRLTRGTVKSLHGKVRIYGDDIIVPREYARSVCAVLEEHGLKVNHRKSFWTGKFRESCGGDYYDGVNTTPVRARADLPVTHADAAGVTAWVAFRNLAYLRGLSRTVMALDAALEAALKGRFPFINPDSPILGRWTYDPVNPVRLDPDFHHGSANGWIPEPVKRFNPLDGPGALMKYFLTTRDLPVTDRDHLQYSGRPVAVTLKRRWATIGVQPLAQWSEAALVKRTDAMAG